MDEDGYINCFELMEAALSSNDEVNNDEVVFDELINIYPTSNNEIQSMILGAIGAVYKNDELL